ncbi:alkaline-phosphatase-like protein [Hypoxylon cercidicola]|nr:alkaline-phosphatase-like protein [Hypoxylon cercidicola]
MVLLRQKLLLLAANLLVPIGALIFMTGYFRGRPNTPAPAGVIADRKIAANSAPFHKVVFMVIDALRSDFVYAENSGFTFTQELISSGAAVPFTARAASPTLTMSRIKAMTQGTSQTFLDLWLNIANSPNAARQSNVDTWLSRLKTERDPDKNMVYYGTKTWLMLYPDIFDRHDGVDSYYVPDFTIVDQNITRHIPHELQRDDWKALVMHFPGLDHLAHQGGPYSAHMLPKQKQLDGVVQQIYNAIEQEPHMKDTLFVLAGDHGMNEKGNHGGSAPGEIASALTFISPKFRQISKGVECPVKATENYEYYSVIEQVDIVPILSGLLGFSIPVNSLGMFVSDFVRLFRAPEDGVRFLLRNAQQMLNLFKTKVDFSNAVEESSVCDSNCSGCLTDEGEIACLWGKVSNANDEWEKTKESSSQELIEVIDDFSRAVQKSLSVPLNNLHTTRLLAGMASLLVAMLFLLLGVSLSHIPVDSGVVGFGLLVSLHAATMFVSKLVEEEHHYWYWASLAWMAYLGAKSISCGQPWFWATIPAILQYLTQCWNQSGDTTYPMIDLLHDFLFNNPLLLWALALAAYALSANSLANNLGMGTLFPRVMSSLLCIMAAFFKVCVTQRDNPELLIFMPQSLKIAMLEVDQTQLLRIIWTYMFGCAICLVSQLKPSAQANRRNVMNGALELANLYLMLQSRPKNLALYPIFDLQLQWFLHSTKLSPSEISLTSLVLAQSSFYAVGGSNSVASLDITNGFNGIQGYNVTAVFLQTVLSNWVGPVWWTLGGLRLLLAWLENQSTLDSHQTTGYQDGSVATNGKAQQNGGTNGQSTAPLNGNDVTHRNTTPAKCKTRAAPTLARSGEVFFEYLTFHTFYTASSSLAVMLACVWLRDDPSLWTVLAPKYVYVGLWTVFQQLLINFGLSSFEGRLTFTKAHVCLD